MKKINKKVITISLVSLITSAAIIAPLSVATRTIESKNNSSSASTAYVNFTTGEYGKTVSIIGTAKVRAKVGRQLCTVNFPKAIHENNWRFLGWSLDGTHEVDPTTIIPAAGLTLKPMFDKPVSIENCLGISAMENTNITVHFQTTDAPKLSYSNDFGATWHDVVDGQKILVTGGYCLYMRGTGFGDDHKFSTSETNYTHIEFDNEVNLFGNILSLIYNAEPTTSLTKIPNSYCFYHLFENNTKIAYVADDFLLPAGSETVTDVLKPHCYDGLFKGCTSLSHAPKLPASNACIATAQGCYKEIFSGCSKVDYIHTLFSGNFGDSTYSESFTDWVKDVKSTGTIIYDGSDTTTGSSALPTGWTVSGIPTEIVIDTPETTQCVVDHKYSFSAKCKKGGVEVPDQGILWKTSDVSVATIDHNSGVLTGKSVDKSTTITVTAVSKANPKVTKDISVTIIPIDLDDCTKVTAIENCNLSWTFVGQGIGEKKEIPNFKYSKDGTMWHDTVMDTPISISSGEAIYIKGNNPLGLSSGDSSSYTNWITTGKINIDGDIRGLIFDGRSDKKTAAIPCNYCFNSLFAETKIVNINSTFLSFTSLTKGCYTHMFDGCTELLNAPSLPAEELKESCYAYMYWGCSKLAAAPELNSTKLAGYCYQSMFYECSSLTVAPKLPATTPAEGCYSYMFQLCTSLTSVGKISLTSLATKCCQQMFCWAGICTETTTRVKGSSKQQSNYFFQCPTIPTDSKAVDSMFTSNPKVTANYYYYLS